MKFIKVRNYTDERVNSSSNMVEINTLSELVAFAKAGYGEVVVNFDQLDYAGNSMPPTIMLSCHGFPVLPSVEKLYQSTGKDKEENGKKHDWD